MILAFRQSVLIIDLVKTITSLKYAFYILAYAVLQYGSIWFVNLEQAFYKLNKQFALKAGEFFISMYWIRGMVTNFSLKPNPL